MTSLETLHREAHRLGLRATVEYSSEAYYITVRSDLKTYRNVRIPKQGEDYPNLVRSLLVEPIK